VETEMADADEETLAVVEAEGLLPVELAVAEGVAVATRSASAMAVVVKSWAVEKTVVVTPPMTSVSLKLNDWATNTMGVALTGLAVRVMAAVLNGNAEEVVVRGRGLALQHDWGRTAGSLNPSGGTT
jgi:hypothetical protein